MARVPAFQAGCCEFESRLPLHKESDESLTLYFMSPKTASHSSILLMLFAIYGVLPIRVSAFVRLVFLANDGGESRCFSPLRRMSNRDKVPTWLPLHKESDESLDIFLSNGISLVLFL